jgi:hypothetical protein
VARGGEGRQEDSVTTIRKIVESPLTVAHVLELAANADKATDVLIVRKK